MERGKHTSSKCGKEVIVPEGVGGTSCKQCKGEVLGDIRLAIEEVFLMSISQQTRKEESCKVSQSRGDQA